MVGAHGLTVEAEEVISKGQRRGCCQGRLCPTEGKLRAGLTLDPASLTVRQELAWLPFRIRLLRILDTIYPVPNFGKAFGLIDSSLATVLRPKLRPFNGYITSCRIGYDAVEEQE